MIREVQKLHTKALSWKRMFELGLEYRYVSQFLQNKMTKAEMIQKLETEIWHYVRRQKQWFGYDKTIQWFKPSEIKKIEKEVVRFLKR